jgi:hypothetical protein
VKRYWIIALIGGTCLAAPPRTPGGQPDLQGIWTNATITPLERPAELAGKQFFTEAEAAAYEKQIAVRNDVDKRPTSVETDVALGYNAAWWDRGTRVVKTLRTSLIVDPPDGKIPALTADGERRAAALAAERKAHPADGPEDRSLGERCLVWPTGGPPMMPGPYNSNYQILQIPGYVVIFIEMIHDARIIPLDGRPHLPSSVRQWMGDSRGHWEGNTLVVDVKNFNDETWFDHAGNFHSDALHVVERYTPASPEVLLYEATIEDSKVFTRPWKISFPLYRRVDKNAQFMEFKCVPFSEELIYGHLRKKGGK